MNPKLSLVIPAYNESSRLGNSLETVFAYLNQTDLGAEVIVVDDGSSDATVHVAQESFAAASNIQTSLIPVHPNRGKGYAVRTGLIAARAPIAIFFDADLSTPIEEIPKVVLPIERDGYDVVFGSRALDRSLIGVHQPWRREMGGRAFNLLVRLSTGLPFADTQCGFKAFRLSTCRPVIDAAVIDRFAFDVELLYLAQSMGLRLKEVPVRWDHNDGSKVNVLRDSLRMFREVQSIRRRSRASLSKIAPSDVRSYKYTEHSTPYSRT
jgi:glycosyltransferase involved in cell wall biosynthesis